MSFELRYHQQVVQKDIPALPRKERGRVQKAILEKLTTRPEIFSKPLQHAFKGYRRLRVGDYRVIVRIQEKTVKIFAIGHRSTIYENYTHRLI